MTDAKPHFVTLEELIEADDRETEDIHVPEWGGWVKLVSLTKQEQLDIRNEAMVGGEPDPGRAEMLALAKCMREPEVTAEHVGVLASKNAAVIARLMTRVAVLAGLDEETAAKEAKKKFRDGTGPEVRVPTSEGPPHDRPADAPDDAGD